MNPSRPEPMRLPDNYPELLEFVAQLVYRDLCERGIHPEVAEKTALAASDSICAEFGGTQVYIPRSLSYRLSQRDAEIFREFRGDNYAQLARKHSLSEMQIRTIVRRGAEIERRRNQPDLF